MLHDLRYALRTLRQNPGFALVAIISLALGIGASSAMFSSADALVLRPLPVPDSSGIVTVQSQLQGEGNSNSISPRSGLSYPDYKDLRDRNRSFSGLVAARSVLCGVAVEKGALSEMRLGELVSGNYFSVLGVEPELGRGFRTEEDKVPGRDAVVVLSHDLWKNAFASSPDVIGRDIFLNGITFTVIGVAPDLFFGISNRFGRADLFVPLAMGPRLTGDAQQTTLDHRDVRALDVRGRLRAGISLPQAAAETRVIGQQLARAYPDTNRTASLLALTDLQSRLQRDPINTTIIVLLLSLAAIVLLIACANVMNLTLIRARARSREIAVRLAIGAGRGRLVRQLLTESLVIAVLGGALGLLVAQANVDLFSRFHIPSTPPIVFDVRLDTRVLLFALLVSVATTLLFGLAPAMKATKADLVPALKSGKAGGGKRRRFLGRNMLVIAQVAGSLVLLVFATQAYRGARILFSGSPGFRVDHLLIADFDPTLARYTPAQTRDFYKRLLEKAQALPGVKSAAFAQDVPMGVTRGSGVSRVVPEGFQLPSGAEAISVFSSTVSEGYFGTMEIPIIEGREFRETDRADSPRVAIVNETFARKYFPGRSATGRRFRLDGAGGPAVEIVGVAKQSKYFFVIESPQERVYLPQSQDPSAGRTLLLETDGPPREMAAPLREMVRSLDASLPVFGVRTMEEFFNQRATVAVDTLIEQVAGMGLLGLLLAMVGLYGLMTYSVGLRQREIGIRMAVGADQAGVLRMVLRQGMLLAGTGVALGLILTLLAAKPAASMVDARGFYAPLVALVGAGLLAVAALGAYIPARRASHLDPNMVLRQE
jgi:predicted permease